MAIEYFIISGNVHRLSHIYVFKVNEPIYKMRWRLFRTLGQQGLAKVLWPQINCVLTRFLWIGLILPKIV